MKLSIVTTLYRSAPTIVEFSRRALEAASRLSSEVELVIVNDGSPDNSRDIVLQMQSEDPRIVFVDLARNFGHHRAMMTGLAQSSGDLVFLIDCDLEEEPELLPGFYDHMKQVGCDVVYGVQTSRKGGLLERVSGSFFFGLIDALSDHEIPRNAIVARLMTRDYVTALTKHRDQEFMMIHLMQLAGFTQVAMPVRKHASSPTTYSLSMRIEMAIKFVTTTSTKILYLILYTGIAIFGLSVGVICYFLGRYAMSGIGVDGFTSQIVSIWFLGGLITLILGIFGVYIANILSETKRRPYTIIRKIHRSQQAPPVVAAAIETPSNVHVSRDFVG